MDPDRVHHPLHHFLAGDLVRKLGKSRLDSKNRVHWHRVALFHMTAFGRARIVHTHAFQRRLRL